MKKIYSMKKVLLVAAALFACNTMFAQLTETFAQSSGATKDAAITGTSYTIPGTYNAGGGSNKAGTMPSNGVKLRTGQDGGKVEFLVNKPYTIAALEIEAIANDTGVDPELPAIKVTGVEVDGVAAEFTGGVFLPSGKGESDILTIPNINAKEVITIHFDNSNVTKNKQLNACYTVTYNEPAADKPTITLTPDTVHLIPGANYQIMPTIVPATFTEDCVWYAGDIETFMENGGVSPENDVIELGENGLITAKGAGEIPVKLTWIGNPGVDEDTTVVVVSDFKAKEHQVAKSYDFTAMGDVELAIGGESFLIWNAGNKQCNGVQFCTNEGLENLAFQAVVNSSNSKGYKIVDGEGLVSVSAGRCGAVGGLKKGQYVEFVYTGVIFETMDYTMDLKLGPDAGAAKDVINEEVGRAIYQVKDKDGETEDLMVGFEINRGEYIKSITIYEEAADPTTIQEVESVAEKSAAVYNLMGMKVATGAKGLLIQNGKKFVVK